MPEAPVLTLDPSAAAEPKGLSNPVIDDTNIKAMAAKFRENWTTEKPKPETEPDPSKMAPPPPAKTEPPKPDAAAATTPATTDKPAVSPEDDIPGPDATVPLSRQNWQKLHASRNDVRAKLEREEKKAAEALAKAQTLETELGKLKSGIPSDIEALKSAAAEKEKLAKEHAELLAQVETLNLERSPRFQNWWKTETSKHLAIAQRHVPAAQREELKDLLLAPPSPERDAKLDAIIEPLSGTAKRLINGAVEQLEIVKIQREEALTKGSENWSKLQEADRAERAKTESQVAQRVAALTDKALTTARRLPSFQVDPNDPASSESVKANEAWVRSVVAGHVDEETATLIPAAAVEYLRLTQKEIPRLTAEIAKRDALIKQLQSASPSPGDASGGRAAPPEAPSGTSFASKVRNLMQGK